MPEHVQPALTELIAQACARIDEIAAEPSPRTWGNTMAALDRASEPLDFAVSIVRHLEGVVSSPELREAWNSAQPEVSAFYSSIPLHEGLWAALNAYAATDEAKHLQGVQARFLHKTMDAFRRQGAELDADGKKAMEALDVDLAVTTTTFGQNVLDATAAFEYWIDDESKLAGLPPSAISAARAAAEAAHATAEAHAAPQPHSAAAPNSNTTPEPHTAAEAAPATAEAHAAPQPHSAAAAAKPRWRFTLQAPSYLAVITFLDDPAVREELYRAYSRRAAEANSGLIAKILELRRRKAKILGFADFADLNLVERMAKNGATAQTFLHDLRLKTEPAFSRENEELLAFRRHAQGDPAAVMQPWDVAYWSEKQRSALYAFEEEDLRPYFAVESVLNGMFDLVQRLFGIHVVEGPAVPVWHTDVKYYVIRDDDSTLLGSFYADWFPRETKRGGAWMDSFYTGHFLDGQWHPHIGLMCGNLTPPLDGRPALLTHREAETVFHEFGHLLHHCLSRVEVKSLSGTSVAWDFVELPSQIMENWCWERASLDLFARHWQTGEPIPDELFEKMKRARTYRGANGQMRQLGFGTVDLALHIHYDPLRDGDALPWANAILAHFAAAPLPTDYAMLAGFTHLFGDPTGYGAGYYSYKWAEVLDADAFTRFQREGIFNSETGRAFRDCILSQGDSDDPATLFRNFMGRDPDPGALLVRLALE